MCGFLVHSYRYFGFEIPGIEGAIIIVAFFISNNSAFLICFE